MAGGRPKLTLILSDDEREALLRLVRRGKVAQRTALRARIVLSLKPELNCQRVRPTDNVPDHSSVRGNTKVDAAFPVDDVAIMRSPR